MPYELLRMVASLDSSGVRKSKGDFDTLKKSVDGVVDSINKIDNASSFSKLSGAIDGISTKLGALQTQADKGINVNFDVIGLDAAETKVRAFLGSLGDKSFTVTGNADMSKAETGADRLKGVMDSLDGDTATVTGNYKDNASGGITKTLAEADHLDGKNSNVQVGEKGAASTLASLLGIGREADHLNGQNVKLNVDSSNLNGLNTGIDALNGRFESLSTFMAMVPFPVTLAGITGLGGAALAATASVGGLAEAVGGGLVAGGAAAIGTFASLYAGAYSAAGAIAQAGANALGMGDSFGTLAGEVKAAGDQVKAANGLIAMMPAGTAAAAAAQNQLAIAQRYQAAATQEQIAWWNQYGPAANTFTAALDTLRLGFVAVTSAMSGELLPLMTDFINLGISMLPNIGNAMVSLVDGVNQAGAAFLSTVQSAQNMQIIADIIQLIGDSAGPALQILGDGFIIALNTAAPLISVIQGLQGQIVAVADAAATWVQSAQGTQTIADVWNVLLGYAGQLVSAVYNVAAAFGILGTAIYSSGITDQAIAGFQSFAQGFRDAAANGTQAGGAITTAFAAVPPVMSAAMGAVGALVSEILRVAAAALTMQNDATGNYVLVDIFNAIRDAAAPLGDLLLNTFSQIGPILPDLIKNFAEIAKVFLGSTDPLISLLKGLNTLLGVFNSLPGPVKTAVADLVAFHSIMSTLGGGGAISMAVGGLGSFVSTFATLRALSGVATTLEGVSTAMGGMGAAGVAAESGLAVVATEGAAAGVGGTAAGAGGVAAAGGLTALLAAALPIVAVVAAVVAVLALLAGAAYLIYANWDTIGPYFQAVWDTVKNIFNTALSAIVGLVTQLGSQISSWWATFSQQFASSEAGQSIMDLSSTISDAFGIIQSVVSTVAPVVVQILQNSWGTLGGIVSGIWTALSGVISGALDVILGLISVFVGVLTGNWEMAWTGLQTAAGGIWTAISAVVQGGIQIISAIISGFGASLLAIWTPIWAALSPVVMPIIAGIGSAISTGFTAVVSTVGSILSGIGTVISTVLSGAVSIVTTVVGAIGSAISTGFSAAVSTVGSILQGIVTVFTTVFNAVAAVVGPILQIVVQVIVIGLALLIGTVAIILYGLVTLFTTIFTSIVAVVTPIVQSIVTTISTILSTIGAIVGPIVQAAWDLIVSIFNTGVSTVTSVVTTVSTAISTAWQAVSDTVGPIVQAIWDTIVAIFNTGVQTVTDVVNTVSTAVSTAWQTVSDTVGPIVQALWDTITAAFTTGNDSVNTTMTTISDFLTTTWQSILDTVQPIIQAFWDFVVLAWTDISTQTTTIFQAIWDFLTTTWQSIYDTVQPIIQTIWDFIVQAWTDISTQTTTIFNEIWTTLTDIWTQISTTVSDTVTGIVTTVQTAWDSIVAGAESFGQSFYDTVYNAFSTAVAEGGRIMAGFLNGIASALTSIGDPLGVAGTLSGAANSITEMTTFQRGGLWRGAAEDPGRGGLGRGSRPRAIWNEGGPEAYIAKEGPRDNQLKYLSTAASWFGLTLVGARDTGGDFGQKLWSTRGQTRPFRRGGIYGTLGYGKNVGQRLGLQFASGGYSDGGWPAPTGTLFYQRGGQCRDCQDRPQLYQGGGLSESQISAGQGWFNSILGAPYIYGSAGPDGYDCAGLWCSIADVVASGSPSYNKWAGTYDFAAGMPGWSPGYGQLTIGVDLGGWGGPDGTHMGGNIGGMAGDATVGAGVALGTGPESFGSQWYLGDTSYVGGSGGRACTPMCSLFKAAVGALPSFDIGTGPIWDSMDSYLNELPQQIIDWICKQLPGCSGSAAGGGQGGPATGSDVESWKQQALQQLSMSAGPENTSPLNSLMQQESGGDPSIMNTEGSGASGLMQMMPDTFNAYCGSCCDIFDPVCNLMASISYQMDRYGGLQSGGPYRNGGLIPGMRGSSQLVNAHAGERILPIGTTDAVERLANSLVLWSRHDEAVRGAGSGAYAVPANAGGAGADSGLTVHVNNDFSGANFGSGVSLQDVHDVATLASRQSIEDAFKQANGERRMRSRRGGR